jgi:single-strand DNA-binding protein
MNILCISGNLTAKPELKSTQSGKQVASFTVAISEGKDKTEFVNCVAWDKTAELIVQYCDKGDRMTCNGKIQTRKWEDKDGNTRYTTEMIVNQFDFPPKKSSNTESSYNSPVQDDFEDTIPF